MWTVTKDCIYITIFDDEALTYNLLFFLTKSNNKKCITYKYLSIGHDFVEIYRKSNHMVIFIFIKW